MKFEQLLITGICSFVFVGCNSGGSRMKDAEMAALSKSATESMTEMCADRFPEESSRYFGCVIDAWDDFMCGDEMQVVLDRMVQAGDAAKNACPEAIATLEKVKNIWLGYENFRYSAADARIQEERVFQSLPQRPVPKAVPIAPMIVQTAPNAQSEQALEDDFEKKYAQQKRMECARLGKLYLPARGCVP